MESQDLFALLEPVVTSQGVDLVEAGIASGGGNRAVLRIVIHSAQGVSHGDCARVTRAASAAVEESDALRGAYVLEVSSPGMDRQLRHPREFELFEGSPIRVLLREESPDREVNGIVAGRRGEQVVVRNGSGEETAIPWDRIAKAKLVPESPGRSAGRGKER